METMNDYRSSRYDDDADVLSARLAAHRVAPKSPSEALQPEAVPPPPPRSRAARHPLVVFLNFLLTVVVIGAIAAGGTLFYGKVKFDQAGGLDEPRPLTIERGTDVAAIGEMLQRSGAISSKWLFVAGVWFNGEQANLKAGEYLIPGRASMREIMDLMVSGRGILYSITIPEGLTSKQIVERLNNDDILVDAITETPPEGSLLPETYKFSRGDTRQNVLNRMRRERDRIVTDVWNRRASDLPVSNVDELVVLASIVEKETSLADERSRVAAVFINRLRLNMRLQSDPTVIFALFGSDGKPNDFVLSRADLDTPSPFNTYVSDGLPPSPIANPGRASLEAVANPSRTRDLFFVADGSGGHAFAETYEEHLKNVARWREMSKTPSLPDDQPAAAGGDGEAAQ
jgi:peptidoglycan lytic transglycosylase G